MKNIKMKITPVKLLFFILLIPSSSSIADNEKPDEEFLEFLADLETIDNAWSHPIDFYDTSTKNIDDTATETNNE